MATLRPGQVSQATSFACHPLTYPTCRYVNTSDAQAVVGSMATATDGSPQADGLGAGSDLPFEFRSEHNVSQHPSGGLEVQSQRYLSPNDGTFNALQGRCVL